MAKKLDDKKTETKKAESKEVATIDNSFIPATSTSSAAMSAHLKGSSTHFEGVQKSVQGEDKELFSNDIIIPKVWLTQQMSDLFAEGKVKLGDFVSSTTKEVLSSTGTKLPFIVLSMFKRWHTFEIVAGKKEFISSELFTKANMHLKYEDTVEGKQIVRRQVISAYVVLVDDVKKGLKQVYIMDFASTSKGAGRKLLTDISTVESNNYPSWVAWFSLDREQDENEHGKFLVKTVAFEGYLAIDNEKLMGFLRECYDFIQLQKDAITIDDSDLTGKQSLDELDEKAEQAKAARSATDKI